MLKIPLIYFLTLYFLLASSDPCNVKLINCPQEPKSPLSFPRRAQIVFQSGWNKHNCGSAKYTWQLIKGDKIIVFTNNTSKLTIKPYSLEIGQWNVTVQANQVRNHVSHAEIVPTPPIARFKCLERNLFNGSFPFILDASASLNLDDEHGRYDLLKYKWECKDDDIVVKHCSTISGHFINFTTNLLSKFKKRLIVHLDVISPYNLKDTITFKGLPDGKILHPLQQYCLICKKNCDPYTDIQSRTILEIIGAPEDDNVTILWYFWADDKRKKNVFPEKPYIKNVMAGSSKTMFVIEPDHKLFDLWFKHLFCVEVVDKENNENIFFQGCLTFKIKKVSISNCEIVPKIGVATVTKFSVKNCKIVGNISGTNSFHIISRAPGGYELILSQSLSPDMKLHLPSSSEIFMKFIDIDGTEALQKISVEVINKVPNNITDLEWRLRSMLDSHNIVDVNVYLANLINNLKDIKEIRMIQKIIVDILKDIMFMKLDDPLNIIKFMKETFRVIPHETNAVLSRTIVKICHEATRLQNNFHFIKQSDGKLLNDSRELMNCTGIESNQNFSTYQNYHAYSSLRSKKNVDYEDNEIYDTFNDEIVKKNMRLMIYDIDQLYTGLIKRIGDRLFENEETYMITDNKIFLYVRKLSGNNLNGRMEVVKFNTTFIEPIRNASMTELLTVGMCEWNYDLLWWDIDNYITPITRIHKIVITPNTEERLRIPVNIRFLTTVKPTILPKNFKIDKNSKFFEEGVHMIKIPLQDRQSVQIEIESDSSTLMYGLKQNKKPQIKHLSYWNQTLININTTFRTTWYLALYEQENKTADVTLKIYYVGCKTWNFLINRWVRLCNGFYDGNMIHCFCIHTSILAGFVENMDIQFETFLEPDIEVPMCHCYIIFVFTWLICFLYSFIISVIAKNRIMNHNIYYLPDNIYTDTYYYLVHVRTSWRWGAGTTSNITLLISGVAAESVPHVLNYPDPEIRLLQRRTDNCFILATSHSLGELTGITLWSDYSGPAPDWNCERILITEVETGKEWFFLVDKWFTLDEDSDIIYYIKYINSSDSTFIHRCTGLFMDSPYYQHLSKFTKSTVILSMILMIMCLNVILFGPVKFNRKDCFHDPYFTFLKAQIWYNGLLSAIISFTCHHLLFRQILKKFLRIKSSNPKVTRKVRVLHIALAFIIITSLTGLVLWGFWLPTITSCNWLVSSIFGSLFCFLVLQNATALYLKKPEKNDFFEYNKTVMMHLIRWHKKNMFLIFGAPGLRAFLDNLYSPLEALEIRSRKEVYVQRSWTSHMLLDIFMFLLYLIFLNLFVLYSKTDMTYYGNQEISSMINGEHTRYTLLEWVNSIDLIYQYFQIIFLPMLFGKQLYPNYNQPGQLHDYANNMLGIPRLRQLRAPTNSCSIIALMQPLTEFDSCQGEYYTHPDYGKVPGHDDEEMWQYDSRLIARAPKFWGFISRYDGGGFMTYLARTLNNSNISLQNIREQHWIDRKTRALFVEFLLYNVNINEFHSVTIMFEKGATSFYSTKVFITNGVSLILQNGDLYKLQGIIICFVCISTILSYQLFGRFYSKNLSSYDKIWNAFDIFILSCTYIILFLFIKRMQMHEELILELQYSKNNIFVHYFSAMYLNEILVYFGAFLVCAATMRLWKLFHLGLAFRIAETTIINSVKKIISLFFYHLLFLFACAMYLNIALGQFISNCFSIYRSFITILLLGFNISNDVQPSDWKHFYALSIWCILYLFTALVFIKLYISIVIENYSEATKSFSKSEQEEQVFRYLYIKCKYFRRIIKSRLTAGMDLRYEYIEPKSKLKRYANCLKTEASRMELMALLVIKELSTLNEEQLLHLMSRIVFCKFNRRSKLLIYYILNEQSGVKLMKDQRIVDMEILATALLQTHEQRSNIKHQKIKFSQMRSSQFKKLVNAKRVLKATLDKLENY